MMLIADSGSTKCDWVVLNENSHVILREQTKGINPRLMSSSRVIDILCSSDVLLKEKNNINQILFYGAGCGTETSKSGLLALFTEFFPNANTIIEEDLVAAVRGTTTSPGVICILGTGSNCCFFDGFKIHVKQDSLGHIVMDEGSGNYYGKKLLNAYFYKKMPHEMQAKFEKQFDLNTKTVLKHLYELENPSAYLAKFAYFLIENRTNPFIIKIIDTGLEELFDNLIDCYKHELQNCPLHFVGSIAYYLQDEILKKAYQRHIQVRSFVKSPIDNIIKNLDISTLNT